MWCAVATSTQKRPWLCGKAPTSGKVKASHSVVALEAHSASHIWFLKVFLSIFENKLISLTVDMPYLVLGRSPSNSPRTLAEEETLRKCCAKVRLLKHFSVCFLEATPGCGLKRSQPVLWLYSHTWRCLVIFGDEEHILKQWLGFLNDKIIIISHVYTTLSSLVTYLTLLSSKTVWLWKSIQHWF